MKLTEQELKQIIREEMKKIPFQKERLLKSARASKSRERLIREGVFATLKGFVNKAAQATYRGATGRGNLEKGGSIWNRSEKAAKAAERYKGILEKHAGELVGDMMLDIKEEAPDFPNGDEGEDDGAAVFASALMEFFNTYDMIAVAVKEWNKFQDANPGSGETPTEDMIDPVTANAIVNDIRSVVKKMLDYDLEDRFKHKMEEEQKQLNEEEALEQLDELFGIGRDKWAEKEQELTAAEQEPEKPEEPEEDVLDPKTASATWEGLKSMRLPKFLGILGGSMGALGWLANTDWFRELMESMFKEGGFKFITPGDDGAIKWLTDKIGEDVKPGEGILRFIERLSGQDLTGVGATKTDLLKAMEGAGFTPEDLSQVGIQGSDKFKAAWDASVGQADGAAKLGDIFKVDHTPALGNDFNDFRGHGASPLGFKLGSVPKVIAWGLKIAAKKAGRTAISSGFTGTAASTALATAGAASTVAGILGIGLAAAGGAIAALRKKSTMKYGSRAEQLNHVWEELKLFPVPEELAPLQPSKGDPTVAPEPEQLLSQFKVGDIVMYTEVDPKEGERDISVAQITALPGDGGVPALADQLDSKHNRWEGDADKWGNSKKVFTQLQIIAVKSKDRAELGKMAKRPINAAPVFRDEGDGFKSYITKIEDVDPSEVEEYTVVQKPKKPVGEESAATKALGIEASQPAEAPSDAELRMTGPEEGFEKLPQRIQDRLNDPSKSDRLVKAADGIGIQITQEDGVWYGKKKSKGAEGRRKLKRDSFGQGAAAKQAGRGGFAAKRDDVQENTLNESKAYDRWSVLANIRKVEK